MQKLLLLLVFVLFLNNPVEAESIRWDSVSIGYQSTEVVESDDVTGFGIQATKLLDNDFFVFGTYEKTHDYYSSYITSSFGLGYKYTASKNTDLFGAISRVNVEVEGGGPYSFSYRPEKYKGYGLQVGVRAAVTRNIELSGSIQYIDIEDESQTGYGVSALYNFTKQFSTEIGYSEVDSAETLTFSAVYHY